MSDINVNTPMEELTIGGNIYTAGNAKNFKTGDWRSSKPVYISENCKQCGLCFPVCPDNAIPVRSEDKLILIMIIVKVVEFVLKFAHSKQSK